MTNLISQFNVTYDPIHDRLLFKVLTSNDEETRLWLTRRFVQALFKVMEEQLKHLINLDQVTPSPVQPSPAQLATQHSSSGEKSQTIGPASATPTDVKTQVTQEYKATDDTVILHGGEALLVSRIILQPRSGDKLNLILGEEKEGGLQIDLNLNLELLQSIIKMLQDACYSAQWGLHYQVQFTDTNMSQAGTRLH